MKNQNTELMPHADLRTVQAAVDAISNILTLLISEP
jgi:hypothetical protein